MANQQRLQLLVPRAEAAQKIREQLEKARGIRSRRIAGAQDLSSAQDERKAWTHYTGELLNRLFRDASAAWSRTRLVARILTPLTTIAERADYFAEDMDRDIAQLESLLGILELIPEPDALTSRSQRSLDITKPSENVFVVHGHDEAAKQTIARFVEHLGLTPIILHEKPDAGRTIIEKVEAYSNVGFAVILLTPDDMGYAKDTPEKVMGRARQNVILELGYFLGKLGRERVCVLYREVVELPSDFLGVLYVPLGSDEGWKLRLAREMKAAGLAVDLNRTV